MHFSLIYFLFQIIPADLLSLLQKWQYHDLKLHNFKFNDTLQLSETFPFNISTAKTKFQTPQRPPTPMRMFFEGCYSLVCLSFQQLFLTLDT